MLERETETSRHTQRETEGTNGQTETDTRQWKQSLLGLPSKPFSSYGSSYLIDEADRNSVTDVVHKTAAAV